MQKRWNEDGPRIHCVQLTNLVDLFRYSHEFGPQSNPQIVNPHVSSYINESNGTVLLRFGWIHFALLFLSLSVSRFFRLNTICWWARVTLPRNSVTSLLYPTQISFFIGNAAAWRAHRLCIFSPTFAKRSQTEQKSEKGYNSAQQSERMSVPGRSSSPLLPYTAFTDCSRNTAMHT